MYIDTRTRGGCSLSGRKGFPNGFPGEVCTGLARHRHKADGHMDNKILTSVTYSASTTSPQKSPRIIVCSIPAIIPYCKNVAGTSGPRESQCPYPKGRNIPNGEVNIAKLTPDMQVIRRGLGMMRRLPHIEQIAIDIMLKYKPSVVEPQQRQHFVFPSTLSRTATGIRQETYQ
jgi:hypothetical protein